MTTPAIYASCATFWSGRASSATAMNCNRSTWPARPTSVRITEPERKTLPPPRGRPRMRPPSRSKILRRALVRGSTRKELARGLGLSERTLYRRLAQARIVIRARERVDGDWLLRGIELHVDRRVAHVAVEPRVIRQKFAAFRRPSLALGKTALDRPVSVPAPRRYPGYSSLPCRPRRSFSGPSCASPNRRWSKRRRAQALGCGRSGRRPY